ncbi:MAG TPA: LssY C-terminal domain-containing protein [Candidatus Acidoferrum sp.]|nr:LssY C-terminal domain-containing protein [Candidatus Acidoferrum sp.]
MSILRKNVFLKCLGLARPVQRGNASIAAFFFFSLMILVSARPVRANCENIPAGKSFWVRLLDPVASYSSKPGTFIRATLIQSPDCDGAPVFPAGLEVDGEVVAARKVGLGFVHETASLEIIFDRIVTPDGTVLPIASRVMEVDNARETVRNGKIKGILATYTPQGRITDGLGHLPSLNPYSAPSLIVYRLLTVLPEPEIYLPPGTDLRLQLNVPLYVGDQPELPQVSFQMDELERGDVEMLLQKNTTRTYTRKGKEADLVNVMFVGSREQMESAFRSSGWMNGDRISTHSVLREFRAFLTLSNYPTAPITTQYLQGQRQEVTWQRSFNSYSRRDHLRLWEEPGTVLGQDAWLGAYSRETSAALSVTQHKFIHHLDRNLDDGVNMLVRDLTLAGCVKSVQLLPRPELHNTFMNATGDEMRTDGVMTVVQLADCENSAATLARANPLIPVRPHSWLARYLRTQVLVYRGDVVRGNLIFSGYYVGRVCIHAFRSRHQHGQEQDADGLPLSPISPDTLFPQFAYNGAAVAAAR